MPDTVPNTADAILAGLGAGLPLLIVQFVATLLLLGIGVAVYMAITPLHERRLVAEGNVAAGLSLGGAVLAIAIPLAATLGSTTVLLDIVVWGVVALLLQLVTFFLVAALMPGLRGRIEAGNVAAACPLVAAQLAVALLNAAAIAG
ncbi:DUF350 domain-containing protein [Roseomonas sp. NAR14]|uniref:DUF350 domain-containing protein n=1 Tax=Roseomonas acroporae TaxID=2937791 RepID=A0A9X2BWE4_9PROT|nr:DUF350 domain-containing protein [Roseomonas acroporae]MCK8783795.1 DUF350 domain-containing protein [Roseomonas acroporae]